MSERDRSPADDRAALTREIAARRAELLATVAELEERLNVPKRLHRARLRARARIEAFVRDNPAGAAGALAAVSAAVGVATWAVVRAVAAARR